MVASPSAFCFDTSGRPELQGGSGEGYSAYISLKKRRFIRFEKLSGVNSLRSHGDFQMINLHFYV